MLKSEEGRFFKYPSTPHLPWSPGVHRDDRVLHDTDMFINKFVVITEKMDGENFSLWSDHCHARSVDSKDHLSRHWIKALHGSIKHLIPNGRRLCGECMFAKHSIHYSELPSYFLLFAVFDYFDDGSWWSLPWGKVQDIAKELGLSLVPELYLGDYNEEEVKKCWTGVSKYGGEQEGYVVRLAGGIEGAKFENSIGKYVRQNHVQTDEFWFSKPVVKNGLTG